MELPNLEIIKALNYQVPLSVVDYVVYFLFDDDELVYIGSTNQIFSRLCSHIRRDFNFNRYYIIGFHPDDNINFREAEKAYIHLLNPRENKQRYSRFDISTVKFFGFEDLEAV